MNTHTTDATPMNVLGGRGAGRRNRRGVVQAGVVGGLATALSATGLTGAFAQGTPDAARNRNMELIQRYYETYAQGDPEALRPFFAPDIVWRIPGQHPLAGDKHGADEVLAFFAQLATAGFAAETIALASGGDWVIDLHRGFSTRGEGSLDITWALAFRIQNDQIAEAINFAFDQAVANVFFWVNFPLKPIPERLANP